MAAVTDPHGVQWNVHRRWWPFPDLVDVIDTDFLSVIFALPFVVLWPFWLAAKALGVRWRIVIERNHTEVESQLVRGYRASGRRINELARQYAQGQFGGHIVL